MELELIRTYYPKGTNAVICQEGQIICHSIELPWRDNLTGESCIPEGRYKVIKRFSQRWQWHLMVANVPGRSFILFHPANDALRELAGCIAPVKLITGVGRGSHSAEATHQVEDLVLPRLEAKEPVFLNVYSLS